MFEAKRGILKEIVAPSETISQAHVSGNLLTCWQWEGSVAKQPAARGVRARLLGLRETPFTL